MAGPAGTYAAAPMPDGGAEQPFATVLRGYERRQVDEYVARQRDQTATLRAQLVEMRRQRRLATDHAEAAEQENRRCSPPQETRPRHRRKASGYGPRSCCGSPSTKPPRRGPAPARNPSPSWNRPAAKPRHTATRWSSH